MKKLIGLLIIIALVATGCSPAAGYQQSQVQSAQDVPDCDVDDLLEGDEDCYGVDLKKKKSKVKKPSATIKPKPTKKPIKVIKAKKKKR